MKYLLGILSFLALITESTSQKFDHAKMDSFFAHLEKHDKAMGSVSLFYGGKEIYQNTIGYIDLENKVNANDSSIYRIGSISKTFTAAIILQMVEEKKLSLDQNIESFFPNIPQAKQITIEHLLRHRSGIKNITDHPSFQFWYMMPKSRKELEDFIVKEELEFTPGTAMKYSNSGYVLLSMIAEKTDGLNYADILQKRIAIPYGLKHSYYAKKANSEDNEAFSYHKSENWTKAVEGHSSIPMGAGAIASTASDVNQFFHHLFTKKIISDHLLKQMKTMQDGYGMGLFTLPFYEMRAFGHNGTIDGFQSMAGYFEKEKLSICYISNGADMLVNDIMIGVLSIYFGKEYDFPNFNDDYDNDLQSYIGNYVSKELPLQIKVSIKDDKLTAQATGQGAFPLSSVDLHKFIFNQAGIKMHFDPINEGMILIQGGKSFHYKKE